MSIEDDFLSDHDLDDLPEKTELDPILPTPNKKDRKTPLIVGLLILFISFAGFYFLQEQEETENQTLIDQQTGEISHLNNEVGRLKELVIILSLDNKKELNITASCWHSLEICNYERALIMGYNHTKPALIKQIDADKVAIAELIKRANELEQRLKVKK